MTFEQAIILEFIGGIKWAGLIILTVFIFRKSAERFVDFLLKEMEKK